MNKNLRLTAPRVSIGLTALIIAATPIVSGGGQTTGQATGQGATVRVVSPQDFILQPAPGSDSGVAEVVFEFESGVARTLLSANAQQPPFPLSATSKTLHFGVCGAGGTDLPGEQIPMTYEAFNAAGSRVGAGRWVFFLGPDMSKPDVRIVSPKNRTLVGPGEAIEVVVAGKEGRSAPTWQTGIRRLTLVDPTHDPQYSDQSPALACDKKHWTKEYHFRYVVPRDAPAGQIINLKAAAEDGAKNIAFASIDLIVQTGFAVVWTTKGRFVGRDTELTHAVEAVFSFTLNPRSGAVECGTATQPYCGSARINFDPGRAGQCSVLRTPSSNVYKIRVGGMRQGNQLKFLSFLKTENARAEYRFACPGGQSNEAGFVDAPDGSIEPEGITIAIPLRDHTTVVKHESAITRGRGFELDHQVELYAPRQNR